MPDPVRSMTGAGTAASDAPAVGRVEAEARSVNHRFLKTTVRAFGPLPALEGVVEDLVRSRMERGHVSVSLRFVPAASGVSRIDERGFQAAASRLRSLATEAGLPEPTVAEVLAVPGVLADPRGGDESEQVLAVARTAADRALQALQGSREREGEHLRREMLRLLDAIGTAAEGVERRAAEVPEAAKTRLEARLRELLRGNGVPVDPATLARECAVLADRSDIREELARLAAHVEHARTLLANGGALGRRLDFLVQEMHREANTIGSKSSDLAITRAVMDVKTHVERLREQAQNVE
jgi:uncharacterized protein (TIGR00255 family)